MIFYPDYSNCLVNLSSSILSYYGIKPYHDTLSYLDILLEKKYKNIVLILLDGMGTNVLNRFSNNNSFLKNHHFTNISSVFPPTTVAATTSLMTGKSPVEHGWLGWSLFFKQIDKIVDVYPNTEKGTKRQAADFHVARKYLPFETIFSDIDKTGKAKSSVLASFLSNDYPTFDTMCSKASEICNNKDNNFVYMYWENPDSDLHQYGFDSSKIKKTLLSLDRQIEAFSGSVTDTLIIVTADHGHTPVKNLHIFDYAEITKMLKRPPSLEARATTFFVKDKDINTFEEKFFSRFSKDDFLLLDKRTLLKKKLFGIGTQHEFSEDFIGDYTAIAIADKAIIGYENAFKSHHAGLTEAEMIVPFIAIKT